MANEVLFFSGINLQNRGAIINSPDAVSDQELVNLRQLNNRVDGVKVKDPVVVASQANIVIATALNNADVLDGVTLATGDRVLVKLQALPEENGIYIVGVSPARSADANTATELNGALIDVIGGTDAQTTQRQTSVVVTLGTDPVTFTQFGVVTTPDATETVKGKAELATQGETDTGTDDTRIVTPLKLATNLATKFSNGTIGDGVTQDPIYNHGLNSDNISVEARLAGGAKSKVSIVWEATDANNITFRVTGTPLTAGQIAVHVSKV